MSNEKRNMELMQTLDDSWNTQDWDTFEKRHRHDVVVRWPAQPATHGVANHRAESIQLFKTFPDNRVGNRPYKTFRWDENGQIVEENLFYDVVGMMKQIGLA